MVRRQRVLLAGGLVVGLLGAGLVFAYVRGLEGRTTAGTELIPVFVADETILAGTLGSEVEGMVTQTEVPERYAAPAAVTEIAAILQQVTVERIDPGETLTATQFATAGSTRGRLPIPKGREAMAMAINLDPGVAGYVAPGDHVSIYVTYRRGDGFTEKILSNVEVLAVEANTSSAAQRLTGSTGATANRLLFILALTPQEAAKLIHGKELGSLWLTLVPQGQRSEPVSPYSPSYESIQAGIDSGVTP